MVDWIMAHWKDILEAIAYIIAGASVIVKTTPTLKDDAFLLPIVKFLGKWVALQKYSPSDKDRPKE